MTREEIEDGFMERLLENCELFGIDTANWDGDEDQAVIIARGIRAAIDRAREDERLRPITEIKLHIPYGAGAV